MTLSESLAVYFEGEGEVRWAARLDAVVATETLEAEEHGVAIDRLYLDDDLPPVEGAELPAKPGHEILRPAARPKVDATSRKAAGSGERILVRLSVRAPRDLKFLIVEDPLPAGFEVLDETASGPFDSQERRDDRQVFFVSDVKAGTTVLSYVLQAVHPGRFTALPARVAAMKAQLAEWDKAQRKPMWPSLAEAPIPLDKTLKQPQAADDPFVYYAN
jgi:hypothetical protein